MLGFAHSLFFSWVFLKQEGSSQARYFVSRLIPAHKDPTYEQVIISLDLTRDILVLLHSSTLGYFTDTAYGLRPLGMCSLIKQIMSPSVIVNMCTFACFRSQDFLSYGPLVLN
jgi:hypothetical protein